MERRVHEPLRQHFRPEFLDLVDEIVVSHALSRHDLRRIAHLAAAGLAGLLAERGVTLTLTNGARSPCDRRGRRSAGRWGRRGAHRLWTWRTASAHCGRDRSLQRFDLT